MKAVIAIALSLAFTGAVSAAESSATLASAEGSVMVNQGKQFVPVQNGQVFAAGDRVMVMQGGSAVLRFSDGCDVTLGGGSITEVPEARSPAAPMVRSAARWDCRRNAACVCSNIRIPKRITSPGKWCTCWPASTARFFANAAEGSVSLFR